MVRFFQRDAIDALLGYRTDAIDDRDDLELRDDGIYVVAPRHMGGMVLAPEVIDELVSHPKRDISQPALPFPFTQDDFLQFEECCCLFRERFQVAPSGEIDSDTLAEVDRRSAPAGELLRALFELDGPARTRRQLPAERYALAILDAIRSLGLDPMCLPRRPKGPVPGVKSHVWKMLSGRDPSFTESNMKSGWELLRSKDNRRIAEQGEEFARCPGDSALTLARGPSSKRVSSP